MRVVTIQARNRYVRFERKINITSFLIIIDETAMNFKEELLKKNVKASGTLNLQSMKLGTNSIVSLASSLQTRKVRMYGC